MLAIAGALLLTPGFVTDAFGFLLLVPPVRWALASLAKRHLKVVNFPGAGPGTGPDNTGDGPVIIEGEYEERP